MDEQTHFNSVIASALYDATPEQRARINALFVANEPIQATTIIEGLVKIIGKNKLMFILTALAEIEIGENAHNN